MIVASHLIVGGAVGKLSKRARIAVPLAFASHYVMDMVPHSCFNMFPVAGVVVSHLGPALSVLAVAVLVSLTFRQRERWVILAAGVIACLPDVLDYAHPITDWFHLLPGSDYLSWVHHNLHCDVILTRPVLGFVTQAVVVAVGLWIVTRKRKRPPGGTPGDVA